MYADVAVETVHALIPLFTNAVEDMVSLGSVGSHLLHSRSDTIAPLHHLPEWIDAPAVSYGNNERIARSSRR